MKDESGKAGERESGRSRPAIERMIVLAKALRANERVTSSGIGLGLEVNRKTIYRDIEFMRDRLGYEVEFSPSRNSYVLIKAPEARL